MKWLCLFLAATVSLVSAEEAWRSQIRPIETGSFPLVRPFKGEFRFGWSNLLVAARAEARLRYEGDLAVMDVKGGTRGIARTFWSMDATHRSVTLLPDFSTVNFRQTEIYKGKQVESEVVMKEGVLWYIRRVPTDPNNRPRWKRVKVYPVRGIVSSMLFLRSLPLADGDVVGLIGFPGDSPYLVEIEVLGRSELKVAGTKHKTIELKFELKRIDSKNDHRLVPHEKFHDGKVWISDDLNRVPLRAEVNIFVGFIFGELSAIRYTGEAP